METDKLAPERPGLRKYVLLLATLVASVTYAAGFSPPGGIWQEGSDDDGQLADDPIIRYTHYHRHRHLTFFYCNATAFSASLVVIVLILILAVWHDREKEKKGAVWALPLRLVMVFGLLSLMAAYAAGTCRDKATSLYLAALLTAIFIYIVLLKLFGWWFPESNSASRGGGATPVPDSDSGAPRSDPSSCAMPGPVPDSESGNVPKVEEKKVKKLKAEERLRKVLMLLATFAVSITYVAGLSTPGGFWDSTVVNYWSDDAILEDHHSLHLTVFLLCNTTAFVASLLTTMLLIIEGRKLREKTTRSLELYTCIAVALVSLVAAYATGSSSSRRKTDTTFYMVSLVGSVLVFILLHGFFYTLCSSPEQQTDGNQQTGDNARTTTTGTC